MPAVMGDGEPGTLWGDTRRPHSAPPASLPMATWAPPGRDSGTEAAQHGRVTKAGALGWGPVRGLSARVSTSMPPSRVPEPTAGQRPERDALPPTSMSLASPETAVAVTFRKTASRSLALFLTR